ncbi:MAG: hypothetical protein CSB13_09340 [Chloroflexi bacterium]|nr:MAG: hypothetical protein CSB13_09340 [Chloroflexota bacterium]
MKQKSPLWITVLFLITGIIAWLFALNSRETAVAMPMTQAGANDCQVYWQGAYHDTFNPDYRSTVGPATTGDTVKLRLRVGQSDLTSARVRVWDDRTNSETYYNMAWDGSFDTDPLTYDYWFADIPVGDEPTILYYFFELNDTLGACTDTDYYIDDDPKFYGGGTGMMSENYAEQSFQITVYDPSFSVPEWMQRGVVYQIFPDRFRDGDAANNPVNGRFSYDRAGGAIVRSNQSNWNYTVCDPRSTYTPSCPNYYGDNFYGGDLQGIIDKIEDGYFDSLGVTVLYLNPIFLSPSNHKYDTADFLAIDPDFGDLATFQTLIATANSHGIKVILDGVFNHTSSDSPYFDYYSRYDSNHNLTSPNAPGIDDNSGACESPSANYRSWYYIPADPGVGGIAAELCDETDSDDPSGAWSLNYNAWYGYGSLPKLQANSTAVRELIWSNGTNSVGPYWTDQGASGWRFDVGADIDPGVTHDPNNDYWEGFRTAVRAVSADTLLLGEEWGDASPLLLGNEWDSVMNYRFRSTLFGWLFTGCSGNGCIGGTYFEDNDNNSASSSGGVSQLNPSQFNARLLSIWEDYPEPAFHAMMNLAGSHDTNRLRWFMKKINNDNDAAAIQRMKEWWLFSFTYPGAPTIYYGDEIGLNHDAVWSGTKWEDDPYNRIPFPWDDASGNTYGYGNGNDTGNNAANADLLGFTRKMASIRHSYRALQDGKVHHGLVIDDANRVYGFARTFASGGSTQTALIALNRSGITHNATFSGLNAPPYNLPDGTQLFDVIEGNHYTVSGDSVTVPVNSNWGVVLLEENKIDQPIPVSALNISENGSDKVLSWPAVTSDTNGDAEVVVAYRIHAGAAGFTPDSSNLLDTVPPAQFGSANQMIEFIHVGGAASGLYYTICAVNGAGVPSECSEFTPTAVQLSQVFVAQSQPSLPWWPGLALGLVSLFAGLVIFGSKRAKSYLSAGNHTQA